MRSGNGSSVGIWDDAAWQDAPSYYVEYYIAAGDVDGDGNIDADDIDRLYAEFDDPASWEPADLDMDNDVDEENSRLWVQDIVGTDFGDADLNKVIDLIRL